MTSQRAGKCHHNNHHAHPGSARMGEAWYEFDLGWYCLCVLQALGIVRGVRTMTAAPEQTRKDGAARVPVRWEGSAAR